VIRARRARLRYCPLLSVTVRYCPLGAQKSGNGDRQDARFLELLHLQETVQTGEISVARSRWGVCAKKKVGVPAGEIGNNFSYAAHRTLVVALDRRRGRRAIRGQLLLSSCIL
jgi:hypothetical protein